MDFPMKIMGFSPSHWFTLEPWHLHGPDPVTGNESALEYTFGYFRDKEGHLRRGFPAARKLGHQGRNEVKIRASKSNK